MELNKSLHTLHLYFFGFRLFIPIVTTFNAPPSFTSTSTFSSSIFCFFFGTSPSSLSSSSIFSSSFFFLHKFSHHLSSLSSSSSYLFSFSFLYLPISFFLPLHPLLISFSSPCLQFFYVDLLSIKQNALHFLAYPVHQFLASLLHCQTYSVFLFLCFCTLLAYFL